MSTPPSNVNQTTNLVSSEPSEIRISNSSENTLDSNNPTSSSNSCSASNYDGSTSCNNSNGDQDLFDFKDLEDFHDFENFKDLGDVKESDNDFDKFFQEMLPTLVSESLFSTTPGEIQPIVPEPITSTEPSQLMKQPASISSKQEQSFSTDPIDQFQSMDFQLVVPSSSEQVSSAISQLVASTTSNLIQSVLQSMTSILLGQFETIRSQSSTSSTSSLSSPIDSQLLMLPPSDPLPLMESQSMTSILPDKVQRVVSQTITSEMVTTSIANSTQQIFHSSDSFQTDHLLGPELVSTTKLDETESMSNLRSEFREINSTTEKKATLRRKIDSSRKKKSYSGSASAAIATVDKKLALLRSFGFDSNENNLKALKKHKCNIDETMNYLLDIQAESGNKKRAEPKVIRKRGFNDSIVQPKKIQSLASSSSELQPVSMTSSVRQPQSMIKETATLTTPHHTHSKAEKETQGKVTVMEERPKIHKPYSVPAAPSKRLISINCPVCFNDYENTITKWTTLNCSHKICTGCCKEMKVTRTTMSGTTHTFVKCSLCDGVTGIEIGTCPNGVMKEKVIPSPCEGYEAYGSIQVNYTVENSKFECVKETFLPNNAEGKAILNLLKIAWERRLCFRIETSAGSDNILAFNIEHKTSRSGGGPNGYPDVHFIKRVELNLMVFGICKKD